MLLLSDILNLYQKENKELIKEISNSEITQERPAKNSVDPFRPYHWMRELEVQKSGKPEPVITIFLTNRECPYKCTMCDLWRNTLNEPTPNGAVPRQIEFALERMEPGSTIKLYNSGNFFDGKAIPREDYRAIAELLAGFDHVIVENHPKMIGPFVEEFAGMLSGSFEVAMGLETIHPEVLPALNKQITAEDYKNAAVYLKDIGVDVRAFILLNPPFLTDREENEAWCLKTVKFAFGCGTDVCTIIPTRAGNGIMDTLWKQGHYRPPSINSLEHVFEEALSLQSGRVFCDTWDLHTFSDCSDCIDERSARLNKMNLEQRITDPVVCSCQ